MKFLVVAQLLFHLFLVTNACTEIRVTSEDDSVVIGRSMEHMLDPKSHIIVEPKGNSHTGRLLPEKCSKPMTWQHKHNVAYVDSLNLPIILGGMNTAGLSVSALMFPGFAKYQGHAVSGALFGGHGGGSEQTAYQQDAAPAPYQGYDQPTSGQQMQGPCQFEMQQFIECAQNQRDITLCQGFNEALRQCKLANGLS